METSLLILLLVVVGLVFFGLAFFNVPRFNWTAGGLFCVTLALLLSEAVFKASV